MTTDYQTGEQSTQASEEKIMQDNLSAYIREMADGIGDLSDNLRHKSADELVRSASDLARRNSGLFLLGSVAIGFGLSRFAKASRSSENGRFDRAADPYGSDTYSYQSGESPSTSPDQPAGH